MTHGEVDRNSEATRTHGESAQPDLQMQEVLDQLASLGGKPIETLTAVEARRQPTPADAVKHLLIEQGKSAEPPPGVTLSHIEIPGAAGSSMATNVYTPEGDGGPFPVVVYFHGGGWVIADKDVYDGGARALAMMAKAVVVAPNYRLAPEDKFPAAHDDAIAAYEWAIDHAASIGGDPARLALAGESAGGNLAVATAIAARDRGLQMSLAVVTVYPIATGGTMSASYAEQANAKPLNQAMMSWFFDKYSRSRADLNDPRIDLVSARLDGLPPVTVINAQLDPLRSDGELLATLLRRAGVPTEQKTFGGVTHEFFGMGAVLDRATEAEEMAARALSRVFG